jgi:hypothetical protein
LDASLEDLTKIIIELLRGKYERNVPMTDTEFIEQTTFV